MLLAGLEITGPCGEVLFGNGNVEWRHSIGDVELGM